MDLESVTASPERFLSVSEVTQTISELIDTAFDGAPIWVRGEVSNFRGRNQRGHLYFNLKDENAVLPAAMFARQASKLEFDLEEGTSVIALGRLNVYAPHGRYQFIVERILPEGIGKLHLEFEKLKKRLAKEGLFDDEHKRELPAYPRHIGVVTSATGAVLRDIQSVIARRFPLAKIILSPAQVQGKGAEHTIVAALKRLSALTAPAVDVIIIGRGGGSIEDLWCFNEEVLARAVFECTIPIVSAVGHETDFTICDFVADHRAATPTQAAEMITPNIPEMVARLKKLASSWVQGISHELKSVRDRLSQYRKSGVLRFPEKMVIDRRQDLEARMEQIDRAVDKTLEGHRTSLRLHHQTLKSLSPYRVLERGYSVVENKEREVISSSDQVTKSEIMTIRLRRGRLQTKVTDVIPPSSDEG